MRLVRLSVALLAAATLAIAASDGPQDATSGMGMVLVDQQARARGFAPHFENPALRPADKPGLITTKNGLIQPDRGDIAVIDDGEGVGLPAFLFDLNGMAVDYLPQDPEAASYRYAVVDGGFDVDAVTAGEFVALGDDDSLPLELPFAFPFFGNAYERVYLNSDGNLTFGEPDFGNTARDVVRAVSGPPRICAFFADLDPTRPDAAIRVHTAADRVVVSWINTPEWVRAGEGRLLNFQATLFSDGRIRVAYPSVQINLGIIGLASGENLPQSVAVDFSEPPDEPFTAAFVEIFLPPDINLAALTQKFYLSHEDAYDFVVIFHDYELPIEDSGFAFYAGVRNYVQGVGPNPLGFEEANIFDFGRDLGSSFRLQGLIYMGELDKYPDDPAQRIDRDEGVSVNTTLSILAHEAGHRFLTRTLLFDEEAGAYAADLLGRQGSHWSFFFNSEGSFLEGAKILDHGPGASPFRFESTEVFRRYSELDLYLMGLLPAEQVPPSFFVSSPDILSSNFNPARQPQGGVLFDGERVDVSINDIVEAMGARKPGPSMSQKHYRYAFILLTQEGSTPSAETIAKMERIRTRFSGYMDEQTRGAWVAQTELVKALTINTWPAFGRLQGDPIEPAVFLDAPAERDLAVELSAPPGLRVPASVTIPEGEFGAFFLMEGAAPGDYVLEARIDDSYNLARSNIRILGDTRPLEAKRIYPFEALVGDPRERLKTGRAGRPMALPFVVEVSDPDGMLYEGVPVKITPSGDGSVSPSESFTDQTGAVLFEWTLASRPGRNTVSIEVIGSDQPPIEIEAYGTIMPVRERNLLREVLGY